MDTTDTNVVPLGRHPTSDELMARARALVPVLQERAQRCEDQRRVPEETIADFERAGLLRLCRPARYGGYEMGWDVLCDLAECWRRPMARRPGCSTSMPITPCWSRPSRRRRRTRSGAGTTTPSRRPRSIRRPRDARRGRLPVLRPARIFERHRLCRLADLRRLDRREGRARRPAFLPGAEERRAGDRRLGHHGARRHRLEELRRHRQVHPVASVSRRPAVAFRHRAGNGGQQGGGLSRAAVRRHGGGRVLGARGRHGARRVRGMAGADRAAHVARRRRRRAAGRRRSSPRAPRPRSTPRMRSTRRRCAAACASSRRAARRAAPSA